MSLELKRELLGIFIGGNGRTEATGYDVRYWPDTRFRGEWRNGKMHGVRYSCGLRYNTVASGSTISGMDLVSNAPTGR